MPTWPGDSQTDGYGPTPERVAVSESPGRHPPVDPDLAPDDPARPRAGRTPSPDGAQSRRRRMQPRILGAIAVGGAAGTLAREALARAIATAPDGWPWATLAANLTGSFVLGLLAGLLIRRFPSDRYVRPLIGTGFCGGLTTFSTLAVEDSLLVKHGHPLLAVAYWALSLAVGLALAAAGLRAARALPRCGPRRRPRGASA